MLIITITNDKSGNFEIANYDYCVYENTNKIAKGRVENHVRAKGWQGLLQKIAARVDRAEVCGGSQDKKIRRLYDFVMREIENEKK